MKFAVSVVLAVIGLLLFVFGLFYWNSPILTVIGFGLGLIGIVALRSG